MTNTPRQIDNAQKVAIWSWTPTPFGNTAPTGSFSYNLRYPGQYADTESGIYQNYYRDYDPATGRYLESDPIGLNGGINTFVYVGNRPTIYVDPSGLDACSCSGAGDAPDPNTYDQLGTTVHDVSVFTPIIGLATDALVLFQFHHGGPLDAQHYGASQDYGNYVYGVYMGATGASLGQALWGANAYAAYEHANYSWVDPASMSQNYTSIPQQNVSMISQGYYDEQAGTLCTVAR